MIYLTSLPAVEKLRTFDYFLEILRILTRVQKVGLAAFGRRQTITSESVEEEVGQACRSDGKVVVAAVQGAGPLIDVDGDVITG